MVTYKQASNANLIVIIATVAVIFGGGYISSIDLEWQFPHSLIVFGITIVLAVSLLYSGLVFSKMIDGYDFKK